MPLTPPEITLEINSGSLTIRTAEAIYHVLVTTGSAPASPPELPAIAAQTPPPTENPSAETEYYTNLSVEMFNEIGELARSLSAFAQKTAAPADMSASQELAERLKAIIAKAKAAAQPAQAGQGEEAGVQDMEPLNAFLQSLAGEPLADCLTTAGQLVEALQSASAAPAAAPASNSIYDFPLELVFQTMYELCTNEAVKKHIKAMWDTADQTFDPGKLETELNQVAAECGGPDEDNFLNLSLKEVLKSMSRATPKDNFQQILKKMASTAEQIFLEQTLPLEAIPKSAGASPAGAAPPTSGNSSPLSLAQSLLASLQAKAQALVPPIIPPVPAPPATAAPELAPLTACLDEISDGVDDLLAGNGAGASDPGLSRTLADTQIQLLRLAVNFNARLRNQDAAAARQAADLALAAVGNGANFDQAAANELLRSLGF